MKKTDIVLGFSFGDEGKGRTVQSLCRSALKEGHKPIVVRFNGGPQAAHTVVNDGITHICSSYGSGVLLGVPTYITSDAMYDPICLLNEYRTLLKQGLSKERIPKVYLSSGCHIITPYDVIVGRINKKVTTDGTCGKGIYATWHRDNFMDGGMKLLYPSPEYYFQTEEEKVMEGFKEIIDEVRRFYQADKELFQTLDEEYNLHALESEFLNALTEIHQLGLTEIVNDSLGADVWLEHNSVFDHIIYEGAQGLLLDMDYGFFPNVTPSHTGLLNIIGNYSLGNNHPLKRKETMVYLVTRTYLTRHGNGYMPKYPLHSESGICCGYDFLFSPEYPETNVNNEWQGEFKVGALEVSLLNEAIMRHHLDTYLPRYGTKFSLVITHMDDVREAGVFYYENHGRLMNTKLVESPERLGKRISEEILLDFEKVYYTDSADGDIKDCKIRKRRKITN